MVLEFYIFLLAGYSPEEAKMMAGSMLYLRLDYLRVCSKRANEDPNLAVALRSNGNYLAAQALRPMVLLRGTGAGAQLCPQLIVAAVLHAMM